MSTYSSVNGEKSQPENPIKLQWSDNQRPLFNFVQKAICRSDCYGSYSRDGKPWTVKEELTVARLSKHWCAITPPVGIHLIRPWDGMARLLVADIDLHDVAKPHKGEDQASPVNPADNLSFALYLVERCRQLGLQPLLFDSNGRGGFHLWLIFDDYLPAGEIRQFGLWLVSEHKDHQVPRPEIFPKQNQIKPDGYGNWVRLPGKHHKSNHYTRIWDGTEFLAGTAGIKILDDYKPQDAELIPEVARTYVPPVKKRASKPADWQGDYDGDNWRCNYSGDLSTLDIIELVEREDMYVREVGNGWHAVLCPWRDEHTTGETAAILPGDEDNWPGWNCYHAHCQDRKLEDLLAWFGRDKVDACCSRKFHEPVVDPIDEFYAQQEKTKLPETETKPEVTPEPQPNPEPMPQPQPEPQPEPKPKAPWYANVLKDEKRRAYSLEEMEAVPPMQWAITHHVPQRSFGCMFGSSGAGKSFLALDMGMSMATGKDFLDRFTVRGPAPILYICSEGQMGFKKRIRAWLNYFGQNPTNKIKFIPSSFNLTDEEEAKRILGLACRDMGEVPHITFVDTLSRNMLGTDKEGKDMSLYVRNLSWLMEQTEGTVVSIHHSGWNADRERGASQLRDSCDFMIKLTPESPEDIPNNEYISVDCVKMKDEEPFKSYVMVRNKVGVYENESSLVWTWNCLKQERKNETTMENTAKQVEAFLLGLGVGEENAIERHRHELILKLSERVYYRRLAEALDAEKVGHKKGTGGKPSMVWRVE